METAQLFGANRKINELLCQKSGRTRPSGRDDHFFVGQNARTSKWNNFSRIKQTPHSKLVFLFICPFMQFESHNFKTVHFLHLLFAILFSATYFPYFYGQKRMGGGGYLKAGADRSAGKQFLIRATCPFNFNRTLR